MKTKHSSKRVNRDSLVMKSSFLDRTRHDDTQRQVSNKIPYPMRRIQRKLSNSGWTAHMIKQYKALVNHEMLDINSIQRYGIPKSMTYVVETYDMIRKYYKSYPNTKEAKEAIRIEAEVERTTNRFISKVERYNLRVNVPKSLEPQHNNVEEYNGERVHIKLEEVFRNGV